MENSQEVFVQQGRDDEQEAKLKALLENLKNENLMLKARLSLELLKSLYDEQTKARPNEPIPSAFIFGSSLEDIKTKINVILTVGGKRIHRATVMIHAASLEPLTMVKILEMEKPDA